jgi:hypothetical protein
MVDSVFEAASYQCNDVVLLRLSRSKSADRTRSRTRDRTIKGSARDSTICVHHGRRGEEKLKILKGVEYLELGGDTESYKSQRI